MDGDPEDEFVLVVRSQGHAFYKGVYAEAEEYPKGEDTGSVFVFMYVTVFDPVGELFQDDLKQKTAQYPQSDVGAATGVVDMGDEVQYRDGKQVCATEGKDELQEVGIVPFDKEDSCSTQKCGEEQDGDDQYRTHSECLKNFLRSKVKI